MRLRRVWWVLGLLCALVGGAHAFTVTAREGQLLLDGVPTALTFARGCDNPAYLPAYHALGFNTLLVRIDSPGSFVMARAKALCDAATREGLYVIIELANGSWSDGLIANPDNPSYTREVAAFLAETLPAVMECPMLVGWMISTVEEEQVVSTVVSFAEYIQAKYGTLEAFNQAYTYKAPDGTTYRSKLVTFRLLTEKTLAPLVSPESHVQARAATDLAEFRAQAAARDAHFRRYLESQYDSLEAINHRWGFSFERWDAIRIETLLQRARERAAPSPLSLLELARYQASVPRQLLSLWATAVRAGVGAEAFLIAGGQTNYRTLIGIPPAYNAVFTECYPGNAEVDLESHNPHAVDIARRGNRFVVFAGILARHTAPERFAHYLYEAPLHGAAGVGVNDWAALSALPAHATAVQRALLDCETRRLFGRRPAPHVAFLFSPYAPGHSVSGRALYGYLPGYLYPGPGLLYFTLRQGTCYGQFDYLAVEDLTPARLARYQTLVALSAFDLPSPAQEALGTFVGAGGTLVADLGAGTMQTDGAYQILPATLTQLLGVQSVPGLFDLRYNLEVYRDTRRFPTLMQGVRSSGIADGYTLTRAGRVIPLPGTDLLFTFVKSRGGLARPIPRPIKPLPRKAAYGVFIRAEGAGQAIYCPFPLYQGWIPGSGLFEEFHRDLFSAGATMQLEQPIDFLSPSAEVARFADGSLAAWTRDGLQPVIRVSNPAYRLFQTSAGLCELGPDGTRLRFTTPGYHLALPLPIQLAPPPTPVQARIEQLTAQSLLLTLAPADGQAPAGAPSLTLRVATGRYRVSPGSRHHLTIFSAGGSRDLEVTATATGLLDLVVPLGCRLLLTTTTPELDIERPTPDDPADLIIDAIPDLVGQ
jgi:hypothetical protein